MEKFGLIKEGKVIETFEDRDSMIKRYIEIEEKDKLGARKLFFNELTEEEKLKIMEERLTELNEFLEQAEGSGRTIRSHTTIYSQELSWLLENTKKYLEIK